MNRYLFILLLLCASCVAFLSAQEREVEVLEADEELLSAVPGQVAVKAFFVSNRNAQSTSFKTALALPLGWRSIGDAQQLSLDIKQGDTVLAAFHVPRGTLAGTYEAVFEVREAGSENIVSRFPFTVQVTQRVEITLEPLDVPDYVLAGEIYRSSFLLANLGNAAVTTELQVKSGENFAFAVDLIQLQLDPGTSRVVVVSVRTPEALGKRVSHVVRLTAIPVGYGEKTATAASTTDVLPRLSTAENPFVTVPSSVEIEAAYQYEDEFNDDFAGKAKLSGDGEFGPAPNRLAYFLSVPYDPDEAIYTESPEFFIDYTTRMVDLFLGNDFYSLSPLTEPSLYGTGIALDVRTDAVDTGVFHHSTAAAPPVITQTGGYISSNDYRFNLLHNLTRFGSIENTVLGSLEGSLLLHGRHALDFEVASAEDTQAFSSTIAGSYEGVSYRLGALYADPYFPGALQDVRDFRADFGIPVTNRFKITSSINRKYSSLLQETPSLLSARSVGMIWGIAPSTSLTATYQTTIEDGGDERNELYEFQDSARIKVSRTVGELKLDLSMALTTEEDRTTGNHSTKEAYRLSINEQLHSGALLGAFLEHDTARTTEFDGGTNFGVTYDTEIVEDTSLRIAYRSSDRYASFYDGRDSLDTDISKKLGNGGSITLRASISPDRAVNRSADADLLSGIGFLATATYQSPFELRIGKKKLGSISGTVIDGETGRGIPDVILRIGDRISVTDLYGNYLFASVSPGTQYVGVDTSRVEGRRIVVGGEPVIVDVTANRDTTLEIELVRPADIRGVVRRFAYPADYGSRINGQTTLKDDGGQEDLLLIATRNGTLQRTLTRKDGDFAFSGLAPGVWTLQIPQSSIPEGYNVEESEITLELTPGSTGAPEFNLIPIKRQIQFQDGGSIGEEAPVIEVP